VRWTYTTGNEVSSPTVSNGVVYVGSEDHKVYALNAFTGAVRWTYTTGDGVDSSPTVSNGVVYVGSADDKVYALDANTGALRWAYTTGNAVVSAPAVSNGVAYVGSEYKVYALDAITEPYATRIRHITDLESV
jgi:outer membrane protein assembly factor BamB